MNCEITRMLNNQKRNKNVSVSWWEATRKYTNEKK